jgi:hypothetical protein
VTLARLFNKKIEGGLDLDHRLAAQANGLGARLRVQFMAQEPGNQLQVGELTLHDGGGALLARNVHGVQSVVDATSNWIAAVLRYPDRTPGSSAQQNILGAAPRKGTWSGHLVAASSKVAYLRPRGRLPPRRPLPPLGRPIGRAFVGLRGDYGSGSRIAVPAHRIVRSPLAGIRASLVAAFSVIAILGFLSLEFPCDEDIEMVKLAVVAILMALPVFSLRTPKGGEDPELACPAQCVPQGSEGASTGSGCASVTFLALTSTPGDATELCEETCTPCSLQVKLTIDCNSCPSGCTYIWENHSFDKNGDEIKTTSGAGSSPGSNSFRQNLTASCSGESATFGVSVAGALHIYPMSCQCL